MRTPRPTSLAARARTRLNAESLEDRSVPSATTFVNDNWHLLLDADNSGTLTAGDIVTNANDTGTLFGAVYGTTAFGTVTSGVGITGPTSVSGDATINDAIANTTTGGTVNVLAGTYAENVVVNKSISILGPNQGVAGTGTRGAEAIVEPGLTSSFNTDSVFQVTASNVTIDGLTIQGSNPVRSGGFTLASGTTVYAAAGVSNFSNINGNASANISGLTVQNNIIQDFTQVGVYGDTTDGTVSTTNTIANNLIRDIPNNGQGGYIGEGVIIYDNFYANVTGNTISNVRTGIRPTTTTSPPAASPPPSATILSVPPSRASTSTSSTSRPRRSPSATTPSRSRTRRFPRPTTSASSSSRSKVRSRKPFRGTTSPASSTASSSLAITPPIPSPWKAVP